MPGKVSLRFQRPAGFFEAAAIEGSNHQTIVCRDESSGLIIGLGSRSIRKRFVNGQLKSIGYLSSLRLDENYRSLGLVARGFRFFRELDLDGKADFYITTIVDSNKVAERTLLRERAGLPIYHKIGRLKTYALSTRRLRRLICLGWEIRNCTQSDLPVLVDFVQSMGLEQELLPYCSITDFLTSDGTFRDLRLSDIFLAFRNGILTGVFGAWDQSRFKQTIVHSYPSWLKCVRPVLNGWSNIRGDPDLPNEGNVLHSVCGCLTVVRDGDPNCFQALLAAYANQHARKPKRLLVGIDERSRLGSAVRNHSHTYDTGVYLVSWNPDQLPSIRHDRPFYLELGCL